MALLSCPIFLAHAKPPTGSGKPQATNFAKETDFLEKAFDPLFLSILKYCEFLGAHWCLMFLNILMDYSENSPFQRIVNLLPHLKAFSPPTFYDQCHNLLDAVAAICGMSFNIRDIGLPPIETCSWMEKMFVWSSSSSSPPPSSSPLPSSPSS